MVALLEQQEFSPSLVEECLRPFLHQGYTYLSSTQEGIPWLDRDQQGSRDDLPSRRIKWGSVKRGLRSPGSLIYFYTDDYKFRGLWKNPWPLVHSSPSSVCEVNWSLASSSPYAVVLFRTFQKRAISRLLQAYGVKIWVDLNVPPVWEDVNLLGVPQGWRSYSTRAYTKEIDYLPREFALAQEHSGLEHPDFLVVGGREKVGALCDRMGWIHIPEHTELALQGRREGEEQGEEAHGG